MRKLIVFACSLLVMSAALAGAAQAAPAEIRSNPRKDFKHAPSGVVIAPTAAGIGNRVIRQFDQNQLDVSANFTSADGSEFTTIYVFRNVSGSVPVWFDMAQQAMETNSSVGRMSLTIPPAAFIPAGMREARGLRAVYAPREKGFVSSGLAFASVGGWYVKLRASSKTLTPQQMVARLEQSFAAIRWPRDSAGAAVSPIAPCRTPLLPLAQAQPTPDAEALVMLSAFVGVPIAPKAQPVPGATWCRDTTPVADGRLYRNNEQTDGYLFAFTDAGRGVSVGPVPSADTVQEDSKPGRPAWVAELRDVHENIGLGIFNSPPPVEQVAELLRSGRSAYSVSTWGKNMNIGINPDVLK
jgi:hypothetical protein